MPLRMLIANIVARYFILALSAHGELIWSRNVCLSLFACEHTRSHTIDATFVKHGQNVLQHVHRRVGIWVHIASLTRSPVQIIEHLLLALTPLFSFNLTVIWYGSQLYINLCRAQTVVHVQLNMSSLVHFVQIPVLWLSNTL